VWEIEGTLKPGERHIYAKRHMYIDEDTWAILEVDHYDGRGQLWRIGEGFLVNDYVQGTANYAAVTVYDVLAGRYIVSNLQNENKRGQDYNYHPTMNDFTPAALRNAGIR
jgi:hypothetical protein